MANKYKQRVAYIERSETKQTRKLQTGSELQRNRTTENRFVQNNCYSKLRNFLLTITGRFASQHVYITRKVRMYLLQNSEILDIPY